jgi:aerobic carbon-monoxide dehydrogenase large subunit
VAKLNTWIGSPVERREDLRFTTGRGQYVDDLVRPDMVHAVILRSPYAHGRILKLSVDAAAKMPGVIGVVTAAEIGTVPKIQLRMEPLPALARFNQPVIAVDKVRYAGEPLAVVVAESIDTAADAAAAIEFDIDALPVLIDAHTAADSDNHLFEQHRTNLALMLSGVAGDVDAAFADAAYRKSATFRVHRHTASPMEPRGILAEWDDVKGRLTVHGACKVPFAIRAQLARDLNLPESAIDVFESDVGGGFGVRGEYYPEDFLISYAARRFRRPVKWIETRQEHLLASAHARETEIELEIACARDGTILALRGIAYSDMGAYIRPNAVTAPRNIAQVISGPYRVPNVHMRVAMAMTNKTPTASYRGPGRYEADFARERLFDMAAKDLGIDPIELRRKNLIASNEMPYVMPKVLPYNSTTQCDSGDYAAALDRCLAEIGWKEIRADNGRCVAGKYHGVGVGCYIEGGGSGPKEIAKLELDRDGQVAVYVGSSALGQGLETVFAQIAADTLETSMQNIKEVLHGSTVHLPEGYGSYASRSVVMGGSAIVAAAQALRKRICELAAARCGCAPGDILLDGIDTVRSKNEIVRVGDLAAAQPNGLLTVTEIFSSSSRTYSYGTHAAHITVDAETGEIELLDYVAVEDVGRIINPQTLHGQTHGAIIQGLGGTLIEELAYNAEGQLVAGSLMDYGLPVATRFPRVKVITTEDWPSPHNPLGAKGAGEGGIIPVAGVIANALAAALASFGAEPAVLPLSAPRVWSMMRPKRAPGNQTSALQSA